MRHSAVQVVIFSSISSMILMALSALVHRAAMGGSSEYAVFNLGRTTKRWRGPLRLGLYVFITGLGGWPWCAACAASSTGSAGGTRCSSGGGLVWKNCSCLPPAILTCEASESDILPCSSFQMLGFYFWWHVMPQFQIFLRCLDISDYGCEWWRWCRFANQWLGCAVSRNSWPGPQILTSWPRRWWRILQLRFWWRQPWILVGLYCCQDYGMLFKMIVLGFVPR